MEIINLENAKKEELKDFKIRETARAILLDNENKIAVINISGNKYYQIVGGGIEDGESIEDGLRRECVEEAGVEINIISKLCDIKEIKKFEKIIQNSYCYIAKIKGIKGSPKFTKKELEYGFVSEWVDLEFLIKENKKRGFDSIAGNYAYIRNIIILSKYKDSMNN